MWLRKFLTSSKPCPSSATARRSSHRPRLRRLSVEALDDRCLLSTFTVTNLLDTGAGSGLAGDLRYCIAHAISGNDTIAFGVTGTIELESVLPGLNTNVAILGPGSAQLTVERDPGLGGSNGNAFGIFAVGSTATVQVSGLTMAKSTSSAISNFGTLTLSDSNLIGNEYGAIYNTGTLTLSHSTLSGNSGVGSIYNTGTLTISDSTLSNEVGVRNTGTLTVIDSTLTKNSNGPGGAIYNYNTGTLTVIGSTLAGNTAGGIGGYPYTGGRGGAIYNEGTLTVRDSTFAGNVAFGSDYDPYHSDGYAAGGAIYSSSGAITVSNSTFTGNGAVGGSINFVPEYGDPYWVGGDGYGGGIAVVGGTAAIDHSTIAGNTAAAGYSSPGYDGFGAGGGIYGIPGAVQLYDTIIAGNSSDGTPDLLGTVASLGHNLIVNSAGGGGFVVTDLLDVDPRLGPLQDNGGPTQTRGLLAGSPALDDGDNTGAPAQDQRGAGFPRILGNAIDIGALEGLTQAPEPPPPALVISNVALREGNSSTTAFAFTVSLSAPSNQAVSVNYATADDTATAGSDYQAASGTLTIPAGQSTATIIVLVNGDRLPEQNALFFVNLSGPTNATIAYGQGQGTIVDDDAWITISDVTVTEGNTGTVIATFTVRMSVACDEAVTIKYATADGSATSGSDYQAASGTLTIPASQTTGTITMLVNGDRLPEANETLLVNLGSTTNGTIADGTGVGTILDDEPRISISDVTKKEGKRNQTTSFTFIVTLSASYDQAVTLSYRTANGTATTSDGDYVVKTGKLTFNPGEATKTITIDVKGDSKTEANETFYLDLFGNSGNSIVTKSRGIGTILNDD